MSAPTPPSPFGSATGSALDVIVVAPAFPSSPAANGGEATTTAGLVASSDFYVSFPPSMARVNGGSGGSPLKSSLKKSLPVAPIKSLKSIRSSFYRNKSSSFDSQCESIKEGLKEDDEGADDLHEARHSLDSSMYAEAHDHAEESPPTQQRSHSTSDADYPTQEIQHQSYSTKRNQRRGNVQLQINGRHVPQLDMVFSYAKQNNYSMGTDDGTSCRFVNGNGRRPSTETLHMLVSGKNNAYDKTLGEQSAVAAGPICTCHESIRNSDHHLCPAVQYQRDAENATIKDGHGDGGAILTNGRNLLRYTLFSPGGTPLASAEAHVYFWKSHDSVIVSDVDGTITKSDVRGVIDTIIQDKFEYCHAGICRLFQGMLSRGVDDADDDDDCKEEDGVELSLQGEAADATFDQRVGKDSNTSGEVRFLYLSARPISLVNQTRKLLGSLAQPSQTHPTSKRKMHTLPAGPVMCHTGPLSSVLYAELIAKNIHEFKADVLARQVTIPFAAARGGSIRRSSSPSLHRLSTDSSDPMSDVSTEWDERLFIAGFGNKLTDAMAYEMAGMDRRDIYIIDKESRVRCMADRGEDSARSSVSASPSSELLPPECSVPDGCCTGDLDRASVDAPRPATNTNKAASMIHSIELSLPAEQRAQQERTGNVVITETDVDIYISNQEQYHANSTAGRPAGRRRSKIRSSIRSIRALSSKKSFARFPSISSTTSSKSTTSKKLYMGYDDPLLLKRVRERMDG